jgi:hypothetical protein
MIIEKAAIAANKNIKKDDIPKAFMTGVKILGTKGPIGLLKSKEFSQGLNNTKDIVGSVISKAASNLKYSDVKREQALKDKASKDAKFLLDESNRKKREAQIKIR